MNRFLRRIQFDFRSAQFFKLKVRRQKQIDIETFISSINLFNKLISL